MDITPIDFVREFLGDFYEQRFVCGTITEDEFYLAQAALIADELDGCAEELFSRSPLPVNFPGGGAIRLVHLREMDGSYFPFLLPVPARTPRNPIICFLGHRFAKEIEAPLRYNLRHVFNPDRIELMWSAQDLSASDVFSEIKTSIRHADMCFFDNRGTADQPNVYIEVGIACAFDVPTIVSEYVGPSGGGAAIPSDFQGLFRIQYVTYQQLFRTLYFGLPNFILKNRGRWTEKRRKRR
ncbi:MAG TPA: hypothetical protein VN380_22945 [Thermoanaerobaculia bacterium]|nr:hypothetical protein [Thermoanaerobaculia bacterium]